MLMILQDTSNINITTENSDDEANPCVSALSERDIQNSISDSNSSVTSDKVQQSYIYIYKLIWKYRCWGSDCVGGLYHN